MHSGQFCEASYKKLAERCITAWLVSKDSSEAIKGIVMNIFLGLHYKTFYPGNLHQCVINLCACHCNFHPCLIFEDKVGN